MAASVSRRLRNGCLIVGGLGVVIAGLAAIDDTCRRFILDTLHGQLPDTLLALHVQRIATQVSAIVPSGNTALLAFVAAGFIIFFAMFRSS